MYQYLLTMSGTLRSRANGNHLPGEEMVVGLFPTEKAVREFMRDNPPVPGIGDNVPETGLLADAIRVRGVGPWNTDGYLVYLLKDGRPVDCDSFYNGVTTEDGEGKFVPDAPFDADRPLCFIDGGELIVPPGYKATVDADGHIDVVPVG